MEDVTVQLADVLWWMVYIGGFLSGLILFYLFMLTASRTPSSMCIGLVLMLGASSASAEWDTVTDRAILSGIAATLDYDSYQLADLRSTIGSMRGSGSSGFFMKTAWTPEYVGDALGFLDDIEYMLGEVYVAGSEPALRVTGEFDSAWTTGDVSDALEALGNIDTQTLLMTQISEDIREYTSYIEYEVSNWLYMIAFAAEDHLPKLGDISDALGSGNITDLLGDILAELQYSTELLEGEESTPTVDDPPFTPPTILGPVIGDLPNIADIGHVDLHRSIEEIALIEPPEMEEVTFELDPPEREGKESWGFTLSTSGLANVPWVYRTFGAEAGQHNMWNEMTFPEFGFTIDFQWYATYLRSYVHAFILAFCGLGCAMWLYEEVRRQG